MNNPVHGLEDLVSSSGSSTPQIDIQCNLLESQLTLQTSQF